MSYDYNFIAVHILNHGVDPPYNMRTQYKDFMSICYDLLFICFLNILSFVHQAARCDCCKVQGNLTETVQWRAEMKHFCDQECLLRFYCQQNQPNMATQKGPENTTLGNKQS